MLGKAQVLSSLYLGKPRPKSAWSLPGKGVGAYKQEEGTDVGVFIQPAELPLCEGV